MHPSIISTSTAHAVYIYDLAKVTNISCASDNKSSWGAQVPFDSRSRSAMHSRLFSSLLPPSWQTYYDYSLLLHEKPTSTLFCFCFIYVYQTSYDEVINHKQEPMCISQRLIGLRSRGRRLTTLGSWRVHRTRRSYRLWATFSGDCKRDLCKT